MSIDRGITGGSCIVHRILYTGYVPQSSPQGNVEIFIEGISEERLVLPDNTAIHFTARFVCIKEAVTIIANAYEVKGLIKRGVGALTTTLIGANTTSEWEEETDLSVTITANTTHGSLVIEVYSDNTHDYTWVAIVDTIEVTT